MPPADKKSRFAPLGQETLASPSFMGLLLTQWLTVINDNAFRWLVVGIGKDYVSTEHHNLILTLGLALFVAPYLTLASPAGYLADRFSKRDVIIACKFAEIVVMGLGILAIYVGQMWFLFLVVAMMGAQSALFAPSKMGQLPEMLPTNRISAANGWFALATFTATIIGMWIGGWLADVTNPRGQNHLWVSAVALIGIAVVGTVCSLLISRYKAANPARRFPWKAHVETWRDLRTLASNRPLFMVMIGIVFFWSVGAISQLNIDQFAFESGTFFESERTPLLVSLVFGVGLGSVLAGSLSRGRIEMGMLFYALLGLAVFSLLLAGLNRPFFNIGKPWNLHLFLAMFLLLSMGASAGLFNVPLAAFIQHRSPPEQRGAMLSATNFCVFAGILASAGLYLLLRIPIHEGAQWRVLSDIQPQPTAVERNEAELKGQAFGQQWQRDPQHPPSIESYLSQVPEHLHLYTLAYLVWEDIEEQKAHGLQPSQLDYYERFSDPLERQVIKNVFLQSGRLPLLSSHHVFLLIGLVTLPVALLTLRLLPQSTARFTLAHLLRLGNAAEVRDAGDWDEGKAAVLLVNRCTPFAHLMLHLTSQRRILEIRWQERPKPSWSRWWAEFWGAIWISSGPQSRQKGLATTRSHILRGGTVAVFPATRPNDSQEPYPPLVFDLVSGIRVPVIPVFIDEDQSGTGAKPGFWSKLLPQRAHSIVIRAGKPRFVDTQEPAQLRRWMQEVGGHNVSAAPHHSTKVPAIRFIETCKKRSKANKIADSTGVRLNCGELLLRSLILRRVLRNEYLDDDENYVAVLVPPSVPSAVTNIALSLDSRIAVNLNYTVSASVLNACLKLCGIKRVVTSRKVMDKLKLELDAELIYLEDLKTKVSWKDKLAALWQAKVLSTQSLVTKLGLDKLQLDDPLTVIFTSGSTGVPKGVVLTHGNISSNVDLIRTAVRLDAHDVLVGILPFFHSFGYTVTLWAVMNLDVGCVYHFNPLDAKIVGKLCKEHGATCLLATPTFLRTYQRRVQPEEFETLEIVVTGAEKLPKEVSDDFEDKFGIRPSEGYGTTELSPVVSVNVPKSRQPGDGRLLAREGSVGLPGPDVKVKVLDLESGEELGKNQPGMLWVSGPNVMKGYLHRDDLTHEVIKDGWYKTGDVAYVDEDGFIHITGRISRFSKIGGEMVPHIQIENSLLEMLRGEVEDDGAYKLVVTSVPDERKGERLVVLHVGLPLSAEQMRQGLQAAGLPPIYIPGQDSFFQVDEIPVLGTGKMDLKGMQEMAKELATSN